MLLKGEGVQKGEERVWRPGPKAKVTVWQRETWNSLKPRGMED